MDFRSYRKKPVIIQAARMENGDYLAIGTADERYVIPGDIFPTIYDPVEIGHPCDVEPQDDPRPSFTDVTHAVFHSGEPVYSGTKDECQCFADSHFPSGGYGIGPVQG